MSRTSRRLKCARSCFWPRWHSHCAFVPLSAAFAAATPGPAPTPGPAAAAKTSADPSTAIDPQVLAKVVPGISKAQVTALLGAPWRTVQYNDLDEVENEFWEYRGKDSQGTYRVHIEFDKQG